MTDPIVEAARRKNLKEGQVLRAEIGNGSGATNGGPNRVIVRFHDSTDNDGNIQYSEPQIVLAGNRNYPLREGVQVLIEWHRFYKKWSITEMYLDYADSVGYDMKALNYGVPENHYTRLTDSILLKTLPFEGTQVMVMPLFYIDEYGNRGFIAQQLVELSTFIPTSGNHALVVLFARTFDNTIEAIASTTQALATAIDSTDWDECFNNAPPESIFSGAYILGDGQTSITMQHVTDDIRQFINVPNTWGVPNPVDKPFLLRSGRQLIMYNLAVEADFTIEGDLVVL